MLPRRASMPRRLKSGAAGSKPRPRGYLIARPSMKAFLLISPVPFGAMRSIT
jgi:hypothetical protein